MNPCNKQPSLVPNPSSVLLAIKQIVEIFCEGCLRNWFLNYSCCTLHALYLQNVLNLEETLSDEGGNEQNRAEGQDVFAALLS